MSNQSAEFGPPGRFEYMEWAKQNHLCEGYRLCLSSVPHCRWQDVVSPDIAERDLFREDAGLEGLLAERYGVPASRVAVVA